MISRRRFVGLATGAATGWPLTGQVQAQGGVRRLGALMAVADDPAEQAVAANLVQGLGALDWHEGGNLRIDWRWAGAARALRALRSGTRVARPRPPGGPGQPICRGSAPAHQHDPDR